MGVFDRLKNDLETHRERGCESTSESKDFVRDYDQQVKSSERSLRERQSRDRDQRG
jgi:hypothetical protein